AWSVAHDRAHLAALTTAERAGPMITTPRVLRYLAMAMLSLVLFRSDALAAPIVFDFSGHMASLLRPVSGTLTIDTALGEITAADLFAVESFTVLKSVDDDGSAPVKIVFSNSQFPSETFDLILPVTTLIGYTGSQICSNTFFTADCGGRV